MVRRSESQFKINDRAYPIRMKIVVPPRGMRTLEIGITVHDWLQRQGNHDYLVGLGVQRKRSRARQLHTTSAR